MKPRIMTNDVKMLDVYWYVISTRAILSLIGSEIINLSALDEKKMSSSIENH